jgi:hypothetical protein
MGPKLLLNVEVMGSSNEMEVMDSNGSNAPLFVIMKH